MTARRSIRHAVGAALGAAMVLAAVPGSAVATTAPRVDLRVLVVTDGQGPVAAIKDRLDREGLPATVLNLADPARPVITPQFLADPNGQHARFQGVVLPNEAPRGLAAAELTALADYERRYSVRQLNAFVYPTAATGFAAPGYAGPLDGTVAQLTQPALSDAFKQLRGPVAFDNNSPVVDESYGYLAAPLPGVSVTPILTGKSPNGAAQGVLAAVLEDNKREQLSLNFAYYAEQIQFRLLAHGLVTWLTKGVHLGLHRNYLSMHVDDVFLPDERWNSTANCTSGELNCPVLPSIRMTQADAEQAKRWQGTNGFEFDMYYNGAGADRAVAEHGSDPLSAWMVRNRNDFRWANHTYSHEYFGCVRDFSVSPWRCKTDQNGQIQWVAEQVIHDEIVRNRDWGTTRGLKSNRAELVSGEHGGTRALPQIPSDNPNFVAALRRAGMEWVGLDASRDRDIRAVGQARGVPRYPMHLFFNTGTKTEAADEYNWIYTSRADGGSGACEAASTCVPPVHPVTGFQDRIIPAQVAFSMRTLTGNDPRPYYLHQSNLAEERIVYPMMDAILGAYRSAFSPNTPLVNPRMSEAGQVLADQAAWRSASVTAYVRGSELVIQSPKGTPVPITAPEGTDHAGLLAPEFGVRYSGERSAVHRAGGTLRLDLPRSWVSP
ncbi:hypothetical protein NLX83_19515 [Allokutzneria sp. A3M-2-11 16]|uniref:hypothetical protein n=1 Tax=Allokutzneria sp. A3M-2-11 16 TaxID=2962043 RepID=UPI0020B72918|nr:hypothetical protein [Allokutzneria sp. A3M-2-11 16]MCP3801450.1 hypothetical protein [Allokutzneria sp. A3M-2-11 16]